MLSSIRIIVLTFVAAILVACGGGSGGTTNGSTDPVDKYVGNWSACVDAGNGLYSAVTLGIAKTGPSSGSMLISANNAYSDAACIVLRGTSSAAEPSTFTIVGTKTVGGNVVDKVSVLYKGVLDTDILFTSGNVLYIGGSGVDAEGYPSSLSQPFFKK